VTPRVDAPQPALATERTDDADPGAAPAPSGEAPASTTRTTHSIVERSDGLDLIGEFKESGFDEPPRLVRRPDGQMVQLTKLLFTTLEAVDGSRDHAAIAAEVSRTLGRKATADNVEFLLEQKLRPLGLLKAPDGSNPPLKKSNPLLALRWRMVLSSERLTNRITAPFSILFRRPIVLLLVPAFFAVSIWILFFHGVGASARQALYSPALLLLLFGLTVLSAGFHEFGHASACRFGGARPGVMGAGAIAVAAGLAWLWWPNGEYRPIQATERGTIIDGVRATRDIPTGRPGLTAPRAIELGGAPWRSDEPPAPDDATTTTTPSEDSDVTTSSVIASTSSIPASTPTGGSAPATDTIAPTTPTATNNPETATSSATPATTSAPTTPTSSPSPTRTTRATTTPTTAASTPSTSAAAPALTSAPSGTTGTAITTTDAGPTTATATTASVETDPPTTDPAATDPPATDPSTTTTTLP
jgi:hypothetical protein